MPSSTSPDEIKWWWWIFCTVGGIFVGVFTAGMYSQRLLGKYVTKTMLDEKCKQCEKDEDKDESSLTRELQNIHSAISAQGREITQVCVDLAEIRGRLRASNGTK